MENRNTYTTEVKYNLGGVFIESYDKLHLLGILRAKPGGSGIHGTFNYKPYPDEYKDWRAAIENHAKINELAAVIEILDYQIKTSHGESKLYIKFRFLENSLREQLETEYRIAPDHFEFVLRTISAGNVSKLTKWWGVITVDMNRIKENGETLRPAMGITWED